MVYKLYRSWYHHRQREWVRNMKKTRYEFPSQPNAFNVIYSVELLTSKQVIQHFQNVLRCFPLIIAAIIFLDSPRTKLYTDILGRWLHGKPQARSTHNIAEQGCRAEHTVQARNEMVFHMSIPKNSIQAWDGRHSNVVPGSYTFCKWNQSTYFNHSN